MRSVPARAPDYFVLDIPRDRFGGFEATVPRHAPQAEIDGVPPLRGAILAFGPRAKPTIVSDMQELPDGAWEHGRASCRDRVCQYVWITGCAGALKKKNKK